MTRYLREQRVSIAKLSCELSSGLVVQPYEESWKVGENVTNYKNATKYEPTVRVSARNAEAGHPVFISEADIENMRNYPEIYEDGEWVMLPEKVHGTQRRLEKTDDELVASSKDLRSKRS